MDWASARAKRRIERHGSLRAAVAFLFAADCFSTSPAAILWNRRPLAAVIPGRGYEVKKESQALIVSRSYIGRFKHRLSDVAAEYQALGQEDEKVGHVLMAKGSIAT